MPLRRPRAAALRPLAGLASLAALAACAHRPRAAAPPPDGTAAAPYTAAQVDAAPRLLGCAQGLAPARDERRTPSASFPMTLVVDADGQVVPGSVNQRAPGAPSVPRRFGPPSAQQDVLTCRYEPGVRGGQQVAVWTTSYFVPR